MSKNDDYYGTLIDTEQAALDEIDELSEPVTVAGMKFTPSRVISELDPIAFRGYVLDMIDARVTDGDWFEWEDESIHDEPEYDDDEDE